MPDPTLNETLAALGLTKRPARGRSAGSYHILKDGAVVHTGDSRETWAWLHERGLLA